MPSSISSSEPGRGGRWPLALLLAVLAFVVLEQALWRSPTLLRFLGRYAAAGPADPLLSTTRIRLLPPPGSEGAVLLLGSSQVREGLSCAAFEAARPGRTCANLAVGGGSPLDVLYVARRSRGRAPRRVVVTGVFPKVLHMEPKAAFTDWRTVSCLARTGAIPHLTAGHRSELAYGLLGGLSETLRTRDALRDVWRVVGGDLRRAWRFEQPGERDRMLAEEPPRPDMYFDTRVGLIDPDTRLGPFTAAQETALLDLVAAERRVGNAVVVIDFPTRPGYETTLHPDVARHYTNFVEKTGARSDLRFIGKEELPALDAADFLDFTHLSSSGREKVSARIAAIVAAM